MKPQAHLCIFPGVAFYFPCVGDGELAFQPGLYFDHPAARVGVWDCPLCGGGGALVLHKPLGEDPGLREGTELQPLPLWPEPVSAVLPNRVFYF